ncbi:exported hypothetical protein [Stenotrophomonas maltophilia]|nr:exported hypothetical protein [Stenotrophomonas maltophilia]
MITGSFRRITSATALRSAIAADPPNPESSSAFPAIPEAPPNALSPAIAPACLAAFAAVSAGAMTVPATSPIPYTQRDAFR